MQTFFKSLTRIAPIAIMFYLIFITSWVLIFTSWAETAEKKRKTKELC